MPFLAAHRISRCSLNSNKAEPVQEERRKGENLHRATRVAQLTADVLQTTEEHESKHVQVNVKDKHKEMIMLSLHTSVHFAYQW